MKIEVYDEKTAEESKNPVSLKLIESAFGLGIIWVTAFNASGQLLGDLVGIRPDGRVDLCMRNPGLAKAGFKFDSGHFIEVRR